MMQFQNESVRKGIDMDLDLVVKGGEVITAFERIRADVGIAEGRIVSLARELTGAKQVIDARNLFVFPGAIDVHTHFQLKLDGLVTADDFENGTKAAACGGVTTIIDFATQEKGESLLEAVKKRRGEADGHVCVDYGLHAALTDWNDRTCDEMAGIVRYGIPSFKMFMIYRERGWIADDAALFGALEEAAGLGAIVTVHAENETVIQMLTARNLAHRKELGAYGHALSRPNFVEYEAIERAITWAEATGGSLYFVHMSTGEGADLVKEARECGLKIYAETCPHYLLLDERIFMTNNGHYYATCPQVKQEEDSERLWQGLADGEVQVVATDSCTFTAAQKNGWAGDFSRIPCGMPGVETMFPLLYSDGAANGRISLNRLVALTSTNAAKVFGLYPRKGTIAIGSDADMILYDPGDSHVVSWRSLQTNCDWSPYEGRKLKGAHRYTIFRGRVIAENGKWTGRAPEGSFIEREPCGKNEPVDVDGPGQR
jgi:dihydropyrimidinase